MLLILVLIARTNRGIIVFELLKRKGAQFLWKTRKTFLMQSVGKMKTVHAIF